MSESETPQIALDEALNCPLCGYDLRGLASPRCPECGHAYDAQAIRDAKHLGIGWLVETELQHPFRAALRTSLRTLLPLSTIGFWKRLPPSAPIVPARLRAFAVWWLLLGWMLGMAFVITAGVIRYNAAQAPAVTVWSGGYSTNVPTYIAQGFSRFTFYDALGGIKGVVIRLLPILLIFAWPLLTFSFLNVFGITFKRAGISAGHLWRVAAYPLPLMIIATYAIRALRPIFGTDLLDRDGPEVYLGLLATTLLHSIGAHVDYLRIRHSLMQSFLVWLLGWLTCAAIVSLFFNQ